jgi:hypothetical protein
MESIAAEGKFYSSGPPNLGATSRVIKEARKLASKNFLTTYITGDQVPGIQ